MQARLRRDGFFGKGQCLVSGLQTDSPVLGEPDILHPREFESAPRLEFDPGSRLEIRREADANFFTPCGSGRGILVAPGKEGGLIQLAGKAKACDPGGGGVHAQRGDGDARGGEGHVGSVGRDRGI